MGKGRKGTWAVKWGRGKQNQSGHRTKRAAVEKGRQKKRAGHKPVKLFYPPGHKKVVETL